MEKSKRLWEEHQHQVCERLNKTREELIADLREVGNGRLFKR